MIQTIFVYSSVMAILFSLACIASLRAKTTIGQSPYSHDTKFCTWEIGLFMLVFMIFYGIRYNVGVDHLAYLEHYQTLYGTERFEPVFLWITQSLNELGVHYTIYFALLAFIQIFFIVYSLKEERYLLPFLVISLFMGQFFWHWMNAIRQDIAACIYVFAVIFIVERKPLKFLFFILLAIGFHKSSILLLPTYFFLYKGKDWTFNRVLQLSLLWLVGYLAIIKLDVLSIFFPLINTFVELMEFDAYSEEVLMRFGDKTTSGVSLYAFLLLDTLIVLNSHKLKEYYNSKKFTIYYNLYYWGMLLQLFLINNMVLARPVRFFRCFKLLMIAYFLYYLYKHPKPSVNILLFIVTLGLLAILYAAIIVNEPYYFFWSAS